jgi:hypothetical protein
MIVPGVLALFGSLLLTVAIRGLRRRPNESELHEGAWFSVEAPSPDDTLLCHQEIGHLGWHRCDGSEWFGDSWAVSEWDDTQEALPVDPEPTLSAAQWDSERGIWRIPVDKDGNYIGEFDGAEVTFWHVVPPAPPSPDSRTPAAKHFDKLMGLRTIAQVEDLLKEERRDHLAKTACRETKLPPLEKTPAPIGYRLLGAAVCVAIPLIATWGMGPHTSEPVAQAADTPAVAPAPPAPAKAWDIYGNEATFTKDKLEYANPWWLHPVTDSAGRLHWPSDQWGSGYSTLGMCLDIAESRRAWGCAAQSQNGIVNADHKAEIHGQESETYYVVNLIS